MRTGDVLEDGALILCCDHNIYCFVHTRAYEMLDLMKEGNHAPTYEVFLDLVQASSRDPDW